MGIYKKYCLQFQDNVFFLFLFSVYKMVYIMGVYNTLNISAVTVMKNSETLRFAPGHLKNKKMCMHAVKKLPYLLRCVPDQ